MSYDHGQRTVFEKSILVSSILLVAVFLGGTKACQEDYDLGSQSTVKTETPEPDNTDATITRTPTITTTPTETVEPTETPEPTATTDDSASAASDSLATELFSELAKLPDDKKDSDSNSGSGSGSKSAGGKSDNWLGKAFDKSADDGSSLDSDNDGFADWFETDNGSDPKNSASVPKLSSLKIKLSYRMKGYDDDMDGLPNKDEQSSGLDPNNPDTDNDGFLDGIEVNSGTDAGNSRSKPADSDHDGVGDDLESELNINPSSPDSDGDGLKDNMELVLGSNPLDPDTDKDGILDGKEYNMGFDPTQKE